MSSGMLQSGIPLPSGRTRRNSSSENANVNANIDLQTGNPFYQMDTNDHHYNSNAKFVSQIPTPFFSSSQPAAMTRTTSITSGANDDGSRRRRNSVGSIVSDVNRSVLSHEQEPRRKKSKSTMVSSHADFNISPQRRRNSTTSGTRKSLQPNYNASMINNNTLINKKDLRPLRDRNFQNAIQQEILDYLLNNKFDIQTNHPVSLKSLRQPTQKGFTIIFTWLYKRLDPGYIFQKSVESELYQILKNLNYPYLETINKSQIGAVGGSSWHKFLGLLHWLVKLNEKMDKVSQDLDLTLLNQPTQEMIQMHQPVPDSLEQQDQVKAKYESMIESLVIEYTMDAYKCFLDSNDDFSMAMNKFQIGFEKFLKVINIDIKVLNDQNETIVTQYEQILQKATKLRRAKERNAALQNDVNAFQNYVSIMEEKSRSWPKKLDNMQLDKEQRSKQIENVETEIRKILTTLDEKDISIEQIEEKNKKRETLLQSLDDIADKSDKMNAILQAKRIENKNVVKNLLNVLDRYNHTLESIIIDRLTMTGRDTPNVKDFQIDIADTLANLNDTIKLEYLQLFVNEKNNDNFSLKSHITEKLIDLVEDIENNCNSIQNDINKINDELLSLQDKVRDNNEETKRTREKALEVQSDIYSMKQDYEKVLTSQRYEIDQMKQKNINTKKMIDQKLNDAKQMVIDRKQTLEAVENQLILKKQDLQNKIFDIVNYTVEFKLKIQDSLEDTKKTVTQELEKLNLE